MKVGVFSDIHAILEVWEVLHDHMLRLLLDGYWCLGDIVGRGYSPIATAQILKMLYDDQPAIHQHAWVKGNHDHNVVDGTVHQMDGRITHEWMNPHDLMIDIAHRKQLVVGEREDLIEWIRQLPIYVANQWDDIFAGIHIVHGRFIVNSHGAVDEDSLWQRCETDEEIRQQVQDLAQFHQGKRPRLILNGHTHIPMIVIYDALTDAITHHNLYEAHHITLSDHQTVLVNTGSVSFPRDRTGHPPRAVKCASYATIHFHNQQELTIQFHHVTLPKGTLRIPSDYDETYGGELKGLCSHD